MTQRRAVYPTAATSLSLARCSVEAQLLFTRLIAAADDQGRLQGDPLLVRSACMPLIDRATTKTVDRWLTELESNGMILRYVASDQPLVQVIKWWEHQGWLRHLRASRWPAPDGWEDRTKGRGEADEVPPTGGQPAADVPPHGGPDVSGDVSEEVDVSSDLASDVRQAVAGATAPSPQEPVDLSLHKITTTHSDLFGKAPNAKATAMYRDLLTKHARGQAEEVRRAMYYCWNSDRAEYGFVKRVKERLLRVAA